jgi:hypothetical protein
MRAVYVNGYKHDNVRDALITTGGTPYGMRKALNFGMRYRGYVVSYEPLEEIEKEFKRYPGEPLIRHPRVTP